MAINSTIREYVVCQAEIPVTFHTALDPDNYIPRQCNECALEFEIRNSNSTGDMYRVLLDFCRACTAVCPSDKTTIGQGPTHTRHQAPTDFSYTTLADTENRTTFSVTLPGSRKRKFTAEEKATAARERARQEAASNTQTLPEHKQIMADITAAGEGIEGLATYLAGKPDAFYGYQRAGINGLTRQLIEDVHIGATGDVMRNTGIDRDPRPQHLRPLSIMKSWHVDANTAERITAALKMLNATAAIAKHYQAAYAIDPTVALMELEMIAGQLEADEIPETDALSKAARYYEDSNSDAPADDEPVVETVDYHGADGGFVQFVNLDDARDEDYRPLRWVDSRNSQTPQQKVLMPVLNPASPACPWSLRQPEQVQEIGRALRTADTADALKKACTRLIEAKFTTIQTQVLWGIFFRTKERLHIAKFGTPSAKAKKFKARLTNPGSAPVQFAKAAVAIQQLSPGDRAYLIPILNKAQRKAQAARA